MKKLIALVLISQLLPLINLYAQDGDYYESETLNIDGQYTEKKAPTAAERMKDLRAKLEAQNEAMVRKKIEQARVQNELLMAKKLQKAFDASMKKIESIDLSDDE